MNNVDKQYLEIARDILDVGQLRRTRSGEVYSMFAPREIRIDLKQGFPLLTTKKVAIQSVITELLWFLRGDSNIKYLLDHNCKIWNRDAYRHFKNRIRRGEISGSSMSYEDYIQYIQKQPEPELIGDLGPIYGKQWRRWETPGTSQYIDQIQDLIKGLQDDPYGRRHIVSAWNVGALDQMGLPPCHIMFQCYVGHDGGLSLKMYQRSADWFLGVPFNIASYALLTEILAQLTGLHTDHLILTFGDAHIYEDHVEPIKTQLQRTPRRLPKLILNPDLIELSQLTHDDIQIIGYKPHDTIKGRLSVGD